MLNDPEITKLLIYALGGVCAILLLAVLILAFKRNVYYVDSEGREIPKGKKNRSQLWREAKEGKKEEVVEEAPPQEVIEEEVVEVKEEKEKVVEEVAEDDTPAVEHTTVVPDLSKIEEEKEDQLQATKEVEVVKASPAIKGALVSLNLNGTTEERVMEYFPCLIGRESSSCDFVILEPAVSRRHARMYVDEEGLIIEDVSEHNGTFVNNQKLPPLGRAEVKEGDIISLGRAKLTIEKYLY